MKKYSAKFMLIEAAIILGISFVAGLLIGICCGAKNVTMMATTFGIMILFVLMIVWCLFGNLFLGIIAQKTMDKNTRENNFDIYSTFVTDGSFTVGAIIRIDESDGRIAYVSYQNPYEFQMVAAKDVTDIKSDYIKGPLGGTTYVYFEFYYNKKRVRIPTFTASNTYSLESEEVMEGIAKADTFRDVLLNAQHM